MYKQVPLVRKKIMTNNYMELNIATYRKERITTILERIKYFERYKELDFVALFGSCYRQEATLLSDIDLLFVFDDKLSGIESMLLREEIYRDDIPEDTVDIVIYTKGNWYNGTSPLTERLKNEGILILYKRDELYE